MHKIAWQSVRAGVRIIKHSPGFRKYDKEVKLEFQRIFYRCYSLTGNLVN